MRFLLFLLLATALAAQPAPPRLIVRADDMGYSHAGNVAILKSCRDGIATSIEVIVPSPWFPEAVQMLAAHTNTDVGIHLALTSEWDGMKWRPLTDAPSLRDADGYFFPMLHPNKNYPARSLVENPWKIEDLEKEFRAQIELARRKIPRVSHVTGHMGCTGFSPSVRALVQKLAKEYGLRAETGTHDVKNARYLGAHRTSEEKITGFLRMIDGLEAGKTYLFVDHPGLDTDEVRALHHIGYEHVAADRQGVTDTYTSPRVREALRARNVRLIGYRDLGN